MLGEVIADRYELVELVGTGGMYVDGENSGSLGPNASIDVGEVSAPGWCNQV